jgi:hypothetical protein
MKIRAPSGQNDCESAVSLIWRSKALVRASHTRAGAQPVVTIRKPSGLNDVHRRRVGLFRRHVGGGADDGAGFGDGLIGQSLLGRLGDAEVDDFRHTPAIDQGHQHVGGLEVAMDDPLLMGVLHRLADSDEQLQPGARRQVCLVA